MSRYRNTNQRRTQFTMLQNAMLRDDTLSLKAKGLLGVMLSFPDDWTYYMSHLIEQSTDGREAHQSAMKELLGAGYVHRQAAKDPETGKLAGWEYLVSDEKLPGACGKTDGRETRQTVQPSVGKPAATNTDSTNTEFTKIKKHSSEIENPSRGTAPADAGESGRNEFFPSQEIAVQAGIDQGQGQQAKTSLEGGKSVREKNHEAEVFLGIWNEHRGNLPAATTMNAKRQADLKRAAKETTPELFALAVKQVASDSFWRQKGYTLDNLLAAQRYVSKAEMWLSKNPWDAPQDATAAPEPAPADDGGLWDFITNRQPPRDPAYAEKARLAEKLARLRDEDVSPELEGGE